MCLGHPGRESECAPSALQVATRPERHQQALASRPPKVASPAARRVLVDMPRPLGSREQHLVALGDLENGVPAATKPPSAGGYAAGSSGHLHLHLHLPPNQMVQFVWL